MSEPGTLNPWDALESIRRLVALPDVWEAKLGQHLAAFKILCLQESSRPALSVPCPNGCGCRHTVLLRHDHTGAVAVCRCPAPQCPDLPVTMAQITPLEVNRTRLAHALAKALDCQPKLAHLKLPETLQFGSWSDQSVPAILTLQTQPAMFRSVLAELVARLRRPFLLFAPTSDYVTAECLELLQNVQAAFFSIDSILTLNPHGSLAARKPPGELFAALDPVSASGEHAHAVRAPRKPPGPRYALHKGLGVWHLVFDGKEADLKHQRGIFYVAYLLSNPLEQPIHALDLIAKIPALSRLQLGLAQIVDDVTGQSVALESHARLQERSLALDDAQAMRRILRKERELEAILESTDASEPVKAETLRDLDALVEFRCRDSARAKDSAQTAANTVRRAIHRFHERLRCAVDAQGNPHPVLSAFADYIQNYILIPSARYSGHGGPYARAGLAGCFTHEPPENVRWG